MPALQRGLLILELLARSPHGVTVSQLTRRLELPKSTSHALLLTFERCGYVQRDEATGRYRIGSRLYALANRSLSSVSLRDRAAPFLYSLMQQTGLTAHLAILEQGEAVLIDKIEPPSGPKLATWVGKRMGLHCTALGKALVAAMPAPDIEQLVRKQGLLRHNENTIGSTKRFLEACELVRQTGYAIDDEEEEIGIRCVGAPILNSDRQVVAAISVAGTAAQIPSIPYLASLVKQTAKAISSHLGLTNGDPPPPEALAVSSMSTRNMPCT